MREEDDTTKVRRLRSVPLVSKSTLEPWKMVLGGICAIVIATASVMAYLGSKASAADVERGFQRNDLEHREYERHDAEHDAILRFMDKRFDRLDAQVDKIAERVHAEKVSPVEHR